VAARAGLDFVLQLSSHSPRQDLATSAHRAKASYQLAAGGMMEYTKRPNILLLGAQSGACLPLLAAAGK
jgi:hypothetical protein